MVKPCFDHLVKEKGGSGMPQCDGVSMGAASVEAEAERAVLRRGRPPAALILNGLALLYSLALVALTVAVPMIDGNPWLEEFGAGSLLVFGGPLLVSVLMWPLLRRSSGWQHLAAVLLACVYLLSTMVLWFVWIYLILPALLNLAAAIARACAPSAALR